MNAENCVARKNVHGSLNEALTRRSRRIPNKHSAKLCARIVLAPNEKKEYFSPMFFYLSISVATPNRSISLSCCDKRVHYNINIIFIVENRVRGTATLPNATEMQTPREKKIEPMKAEPCSSSSWVERMCFAYNYFYIQYRIKNNLLNKHASSTLTYQTMQIPISKMKRALKKRHHGIRWRV